MYKFDNYDGSIVIDGFEKGIAENPYDGLSDMRNVNIISVPGEASVNFSTSKVSSPAIANGSITSANAGTFYLTYTGAASLENNMAINFTAQAGLGVTATIVTTYWIQNLGGAGAGTFQISSTYPTSPTTVHVTNGTGSFTVYQYGKTAAGLTSTGLTYFAYSKVDVYYYSLDAVGQLWSNTSTTTSGYWTFMGASGTSDTGGNGLVYYQASNATRWLFVFRLQSIDFINLATFAWTWGWKPSTGTTSQTAYLKTSTSYHQALVAPDNKVYYCDGNWIGRFYQSSSTTAFVPTDTTTYTFDQTSVLPFNDAAQCLAPLGNQLLIGGQKNVIYPWDTVDINFAFPMFIAEYNIFQMVTVNTNVFIFAGNRGRIYITNGSQAELYVKIPDHLSGTVEPYFAWGGATSNKNQLYFSFTSSTNAGTALTTQYGGIWAIDLDSKAIRLSNKLSFDTYNGYATGLIPNFSATPAGTGLFINWYDGTASGFGIDTTSSSPYTGSQSSIDTDLIPIGTYDKPRDFTRVEYKLTKPMVSGESITIKYRLDFSQSYTTVLTDNTTGNFSLSGSVNFKNAQWVQFQVILNSTATNPSYTRLKNMRILGLTGPSLGQSQQISL